MGYIYRAGIYWAENCKNHFKIVGKIMFKKNDVAADVAQHKSNYVLAFSNI